MSHSPQPIMDNDDGDDWGIVQRFPLIRDVLLIALLVLLIWKLGAAELSLDLGTFRFTDLVSVLLALFTIALSSAFYFRTTETSNRFYDRTFRFTKDISEVLGRIEERFGERLRHVEEGFGGLRDQVSQLDTAEAREQIEEEEEEAEKLKEERDELLEELAERADLREAEREEYLDRIRTLEREVNRTRSEIGSLRRRVARSEPDTDSRPRGGTFRRETRTRHIDRRLRDYLEGRLDSMLGDGQLSNMPPSAIMEMFDDIKELLPTGALDDMKRIGYVDPDRNRLTRRGVRLLRELAESD